MELAAAVNSFEQSIRGGYRPDLSDIALYFNASSHDVIVEHPHFTYDIPQLMEEFSKYCECRPVFRNVVLPTIAIPIGNAFILKIVFSAENDVIYILAHSNSEMERSELLQSDTQFGKALSVYLGKVYDYFQELYDDKGIIMFIKWVHSYSDIHTRTCKVCGELLKIDTFGALVPPIIRDPKNCEAYHYCCAPKFEGLENIGFANNKRTD